MACVVSFINFKGGVGKTTLCVETAASLVYKQSAKVLLVDLDPQTNATFSLFSEKEWEKHARTKGTLKDFFTACCEEKEFDLRKIIMRYKNSMVKNLHVLPSHLELFGIDLKLAQIMGASDIKAKVLLRKAFEKLVEDYNYDFIVIDCPPNLYLATQNGLFASNYYVVVSMAEYLSTFGLGHIQKEISGLFETCNNTLKSLGGEILEPEILGIVFNRLSSASGGTTAEKRIMKEAKERYPNKVFNNFVSKSTQIAVRAEERIPIALSGYASDRMYEQQMSKVAEEFYDRITKD